MSAPSYSVVLPTRNRRATLASTLRALEAQMQAPDFELIVVDDGSDDGTLEWLRARQFSVPHRVIAAAYGGPAAARNQGVAAATGTWVALLGDDTLPTPRWLQRHDAARRAIGDDPSTAIIGYTRWHPRQRVTPFLRFINERGPQFGFGLIEDPASVPFNFFYSSNVTLARELLVWEPFDTSFRGPEWEDTELGLRLSRRGVRIAYERHAEVWHDHDMDLGRFLLRCRRVGRAATVFHALHPDMGPFLGIDGEGSPGPPPSPTVTAVLERVARALEPLPVPAPGLWRYLQRAYYAAGYREAAGADAPAQ